MQKILHKPQWLFALLLLTGIAIGGVLRPSILRLSLVKAGNVIGTQEGVISESVTAISTGPNVSDAFPVVSPVSKASSDQSNVVESLDAHEATVVDRSTNSPLVLTAIDRIKLHPDDLDTYDGLPVGFTEEGYPYIGDPAAPVTLEEYSDFLCPYCSRHFNQTISPIAETYIRTGQVNYVFRDMPLVGLHPTADRGHVAAACAGEQGPAYFWLMHDELFKRQNQWNQTPDPIPFLTSLAEAVGIDMALFQACLADEQMTSAIQARVTIGRELGFNGTPSFQFTQHQTGETYTLVGAHSVATFEQWLDALIAGESPMAEQEEADTPSMPFWANVHGLQPDPQHPGFTLAGDQYKGNPKATLVVIEFGDFQCPACQQHALETQPAVDEAFINNDQIMWVFKHLPLKEHNNAVIAAVAAECAAEQQQFWEMHHLLFEKLDRWATTNDPNEGLLTLVSTNLAIDKDQFISCFNSRQPLERVMADLFDAQGVVQTTPTFIFISNGQGHVMRGSRPANQFISIIEKRLDAANAAPDSTGE